MDYSEVLFTKAEPAAKLRQQGLDAIAMGAGEWAYDAEEQGDNDFAISIQDITKIFITQAWSTFSSAWADEVKLSERELDDAFNNLPGPQQAPCSGCGGSYNAPGLPNARPDWLTPKYHALMKKLFEDYVKLDGTDTEKQLLDDYDQISEELDKLNDGGSDD